MTTQEALQYIKFPLRYDANGQMIFDADDNLVLDVRGWGCFQYRDDGIGIQDAFGRWVVDTLNQAQGSLSAIDKQRYEWLRQQFLVTAEGPDGTYRPIFPDCLQPARTLDESIDLTRGVKMEEVK